jgi:uncharacterized protein YjbI with pentapeptide repeats
VELSKAELSKVELSKAELSKVELSKAELSKAELSKALSKEERSYLYQRCGAIELSAASYTSVGACKMRKLSSEMRS